MLVKKKESSYKRAAAAAVTLCVIVILAIALPALTQDDDYGVSSNAVQTKEQQALTALATIAATSVPPTATPVPPTATPVPTQVSIPTQIPGPQLTLPPDPTHVQIERGN